MPLLSGLTAAEHFGAPPPGRQLRYLSKSHLRLRGGRQTACSDHALPEKLRSARKLKRAGLAVSSALTLLGLSAAGQGDPSGLDIRWLAAAVAAVCTAAIAIGSNFGGRLRVELHQGRIYLQWFESAPTGAPDLEFSSVQVRPTGDSRGNGAFAVKRIAKGTFLGPYEGELLDEKQYWNRYPNGMSDYAICIDQEWTLDGRDRVSDISHFSPCHINHHSRRNNVYRTPLREQRAVHFFAKRDIEAGEELLLDYGRTYWHGREDAELS